MPVTSFIIFCIAGVLSAEAFRAWAERKALGIRGEALRVRSEALESLAQSMVDWSQISVLTNHYLFSKLLLKVGEDGGQDLMRGLFQEIQLTNEEAGTLLWIYNHDDVSVVQKLLRMNTEARLCNPFNTRLVVHRVEDQLVEVQYWVPKQAMVAESLRTSWAEVDLPDYISVKVMCGDPPALEEETPAEPLDLSAGAVREGVASAPDLTEI